MIQETTDLTVDGVDEGTEIKVQSADTGDFHEGVVDENGRVRNPTNGAIYQEEGYMVVNIDGK